MKDSFAAGDRILKGLPSINLGNSKVSNSLRLPIVSHIIKFQEEQSKQEILLVKTMKRIDQLV